MLRPAPPSDWSCAYCAVTVDELGGLFTPPESAVVNGRSKKRPKPPRTIERLRAAQVVGRAEARAERERRRVVGRLRDIPAGQEQPVQRVARARHERADRHRAARPEALAGHADPPRRGCCRCTATPRGSRRRTAAAPAPATTGREGSWRPGRACRTARPGARSACRSRASAGCSPSSCPGHRNPGCDRPRRSRRIAAPAGTS